MDLRSHISGKCPYAPELGDSGSCVRVCQPLEPPNGGYDDEIIIDTPPHSKICIEHIVNDKTELKELQMKYHEQGALLIKYKNEVDEQKKIAKEEAEKYEMEKKKMQESHKAELIAMEKQVRGLEEDKKHLLQQKISKMKQEPSLLQGVAMNIPMIRKIWRKKEKVALNFKFATTCK